MLSEAWHLGATRFTMALHHVNRLQHYVLLMKLDRHTTLTVSYAAGKNACIHCSLRQTTGDIKRKECSLSLEELLPAMQGLMAARAGNAPTFLG